MGLKEKDLVVLCQKGDEKAFEDLYYRFFHELMQVCLRYARDGEEAKDMFQNGFVKIVQNISKYDGSGSLIGWLKRVMVNESINYYHRVSRKGKVIYTEDDTMLERQQELVNPVIEGELGHEELLHVVRSLPDAYRMVFNLYAVEGFSHKEIAAQLNISVSTSKSNLSRARALLRSKLLSRDEVETKLRIQNG